MVNILSHLCLTAQFDWSEVVIRFLRETKFNEEAFALSGKLTVLAHRLTVLEAIGAAASCPIKGEDAVDAVLEVVNGLSSSLQV